MGSKKYTVKLPDIHDPLHQQLLSKDVDEDYKTKAKEFWTNPEIGVWYDIYIKYTETGDKMIIAAKRLTQTEFESIEDKKCYMEGLQHLHYICQYPHKTYQKAVAEFELFSKMNEYDAGDCFSKTEYFPERDYILFSKNKIKCRSLKEGQNYSTRDIIFRSLMYRHLKDEILN